MAGMTDEWIPALARYAERFHKNAGSQHHVASPLGAWLVLALVGSAEPAGDELAEVLGVEPAVASRVARTLLEQPHPLVAAATAVWYAENKLDPQRLARWWDGLPAATETGPLPDQAALDRWAREHTFGLIEEFPVKMGPEVLLVLASALAAKVSWELPFDVVAAEKLGGAWASRLKRVLRTPEDGGHSAFVATSRHAGEVIVHVASAAEQEDWRARMQVVSVAAAADVPPDRVIAAAYEIGQEVVTGGQPASRRSLFDLPLGEGPLWTIREGRAVTHGGEQISAVLPAWSATGTHDLSAPELGFDAASRVLARLIGIPSGFVAKQAAMARFSRYGFEAAAVTGMAQITSASSERTVRSAELRFAHPYAVVALVQQLGPWGGVPVFSAWVADPQDEPAD